MQRHPFLKIFSLLVCLAGSQTSFAWQLNSNDSQIAYLSTKVVTGAVRSATESNTFTSLSGNIDKHGLATVKIDLASVETNIPIRNERMKKHVFETANFPDAVVTAQVPAKVFSTGTQHLALDAKLSLHGVSKALSIPVVTMNDGQGITVISTQPVLLNAADYGMDGGLKLLTKIAKLAHIPTTVPVSFSLTFNNTATAP